MNKSINQQLNKKKYCLRQSQMDIHILSVKFLENKPHFFKEKLSSFSICSYSFSRLIV